MLLGAETDVDDTELEDFVETSCVAVDAWDTVDEATNDDDDDGRTRV